MAESHLRFVWSTSGYELREEEGEAPSPGADVEQDGKTMRVLKVGPSPLPADPRACAYLVA